MVFIPDRKGDYPIHLAIHSRHSYDVVYHLFKAFPVTGKIRDERTKLLPFMLAALGSWENKWDQLNISYRLLREDPLLVFTI